jgi:hypothetical protein
LSRGPGSCNRNRLFLPFFEKDSASMASEYHRGHMDIQEQVSTFKLFNSLTKWGSLYISSFLTWMVLWFCTPAGFVGGLVTFLVLTVLGTLVLREKKPATASAH